MLIEFGSTISDATTQRVLQLDEAISRERFHGVIEVIVAYTSLLVVFDPRCTDCDGLASRLEGLVEAPPSARRTARRWRVPVAYGGPFGLDLEEAAGRLALSSSELISAHASAEYTIAMFGFLPGFAYLSGLPARLALPRRAAPRARIFSGSIAIGGRQTAIGSLEGPSGWNVIGRTPLRLFAPERQPPIPYQPGDTIRFRPIAAEHFARLTEEDER